MTLFDTNYKKTHDKTLILKITKYSLISKSHSTILLLNRIKDNLTQFSMNELKVAWLVTNNSKF